MESRGRPFALSELVLASVLWTMCWLSPSLGQTRPIQPAGGLQLTPEPTTNSAVPQQPPAAAQATPAAAQVSPGATPTAPGTTQAAPGVAEVQPLTPLQALRQTVNQRLEQLSADTERPLELKEKLTKLYQQLVVDIGATEQWQTQAAEWGKRSQSAAASLEAAISKREKQKEPSKEPGLLFLSFEEGQARLRQLEAELATATAEKTRLGEQIANREKRRKELPQLISDAKTQLEQLAAAPTAETAIEDPLLQEATGWAKTTSRTLLTEQIAALEAEQRAYDAEATLLPLQLEIAQAQEKQLQDRVRLVTDELGRIRQDRILSQRSELYDLTKRLPEALKARGNEALKRTDTWLELSNKQASIKQEIESSKAVLSRWKEQRVKMDSRVNPQSGTPDASGFNSWVGLMLRKQRGELPDPNRLAARIRYYQSEMQQADSLLFELEDALYDVKAQQDALERMSNGEEVTVNADETSDEVAADVTSLQQEAKTEAARENMRLLLAKSRKILEDMKLDVDAYLTDLYQVADLKQQTRDLADDYRDLIDKHVLWIRSCDPLKQADSKSVLEAFRWLVSYGNWKSVGEQLLGDMKSRAWWWVLFAIGITVMLGNQARLRRTLGQLGAKADKKNCTQFLLTARAMIITLLISAPVPIILLFLYWRTSSLLADNGLAFSKALSHALLLAAAVFFPMELLRQVCRIDGLAIRHFEWDKSLARLLATNLRWLIDLGIPLSVLIGVFAAHGDTRWEASLGRLAFLALMPLLAMFLARIFVPSRGVLSHYVKEHPGGWLDRLRYIWYFGLVLGPISLMLVSFIGYHYTALRIASHLNASLWTAVVLVVVYCLLKRWLVLNRRKLMLAQARQRLEDAAKREAGTAPPAVNQEAAELNLAAINEQTKRLLASVVVTTGLVVAYLIWSDILPAVSLLDRFTLWSVKGSAPDETVRITLANLVLVVPIIVLLFIAGRNVPGLLEIAFLQHLPLTGAARYAITTLTRYFIVGVGIAVASSTLGLQWSSIQWLVAALGVGLGFGLQEIFANFVSGVILLFEQPIRVGDVITIDGTTGSVLRIRMRATTIVNWDRQELVIPNKDLITGKLLNWTLTDSTNRLVINVGIAYGSDSTRACELLRELCHQHENIMRDPKPVVTFEGFGDNALKLVVRVYLDALDRRLQTIHEMHEAIYRSFNEAGIEIAFPQRDLHVRSLPSAVTDWLSRGAKAAD